MICRRSKAAECVSLLYRRGIRRSVWERLSTASPFLIRRSFGSHSIVVSDQVLSSVARGCAVSAVACSLRYEVTAGESLKELSGFASHVERILALTQRAETPVQVVAIGGGSVGDFAGFCQRVEAWRVPLCRFLRRGWLRLTLRTEEKNALNVGKIKKQIGTIVFAKQIYLLQKSCCFFSPKSARGKRWESC